MFGRGEWNEKKGNGGVFLCLFAFGIEREKQLIILIPAFSFSINCEESKESKNVS